MTHSSKPWVCNTPRNERLSTTNLPHRKNGNVCWPRRTLRESACRIGQAESLTSGETCNAITVKQANLQLKRLFQRQFNEKARRFSSPQLGNDLSCLRTSGFTWRLRESRRNPASSFRGVRRGQADQNPRRAERCCASSDLTPSCARCAWSKRF